MTKHSEGNAPTGAALAAADPARAETPPRPAPFHAFTNSRLALLSLDPFRAFAYWSAQPPALAAARKRIGEGNAALVLRFHELQPAGREDATAGVSFDVPIAAESGNYYLNLWSPGKSLLAELGVKGADGRFAAVARSNLLTLPRDGESPHFEDRRRKVTGVASPLWQPRAHWHVGTDAEEGEADGDLAAGELQGGAGAERFATPWQLREGAGVSAGAPQAISARRGDSPAADPAVETLGSSEETAAAGIGVSSAEWAAPAGVSSLERPAAAEMPYLEVKADIVIYGRAP